MQNMRFNLLLASDIDKSIRPLILQYLTDASTESQAKIAGVKSLRSILLQDTLW